MAPSPLKPLSPDTRIGVIGLGYVGLPLAHALSEHFAVVGYDINSRRIQELNSGHDSNQDVADELLQKQGNILYSDQPEALKSCEVFIITAPTPVNEQNQPDLEPLKSASRLVGGLLNKGHLAIFESTVYPGATEEECIPILEQESGLTCNQDFYVGYSPERINPGDNEHTLTTIVKVTSGSTPEAADKVDSLYKKIVKAGTHPASSIKVAEAAKVIENTQRDLNIALVNELAILFDKMEIDSQEVLNAAGSKWNFLPFSPGLVGGHCIGVDPYYLTYKAQQLGYHPEVILAGRRINDYMGAYVAERVIRLMLSKRIHIIDARVLVLGLAFKENCADTRNTRVTDIISELQSYKAHVEIYDPWVDPSESELLIEQPAAGSYDAVIIAVAHNQYKDMGLSSIRALGKSESVIFDVKHMFPSDQVDGSL